MKVCVELRPNCVSCLHKDVCGMYQALWEAMLKMDDYMQLAENYEYELSYMLADICRKFKCIETD